jgi:hypothetical protein
MPQKIFLPNFKIVVVKVIEFFIIRVLQALRGSLPVLRIEWP